MTTSLSRVVELPHGRAPATLAFGDFCLFPKRRKLVRDSEAVRIGSRAFDLLTTLASRAGDVVPHAELVRQAWPNRVVADCNLKVQIASLQKILGISGSGRRYIESVPLRGYVFVEEVRATPCNDIDLAESDSGGDRLILVVDMPAQERSTDESPLARLITELRALR